MMLLCLILLTVLPIGQSQYPEPKKMSCTDTLPKDFDKASQITCPPNCGYECTDKVMGSGPYHADSPPCCSCTHSGYKGDCMKIVKEPGQTSYEGSTSHDIASVESDGSAWSYSCQPCEPPTTAATTTSTTKPTTTSTTKPTTTSTTKPTTTSTTKPTTTSTTKPTTTSTTKPTTTSTIKSTTTTEEPCACHNTDSTKTTATTKKSAPAPPYRV